jgi:hypothetical protein
MAFTTLFPSTKVLKNKNFPTLVSKGEGGAVLVCGLGKIF